MFDRTQLSLDRDTFTLTFRRSLPAAREAVFEAWTRPEQVRAWWDPTGTPLVECTIDLRAGGAFRFVNEGHSPPFEGVYRIVERPAQLVFDAMGALGTVRLDVAGAVTHMTVTIRCASAEHLEQFLAHGVDAGTVRTLDNLGAFVARGA